MIVDFFEYVKFDGDVLFFVLDLFLQFLSKKSIWHFDVTDWNMQNLMVMFTVEQEYICFLCKFGPKNENRRFILKFGT